MTSRDAPESPTPLQVRLVDEVIEPLLGTAPAHPTQDLMDLGADSMTLLHILARAEELFNVELSPLDMFDDATVAGLATLIDRQRELDRD